MKIQELKQNYRENPAWCWLLATLFLFFVLPEYISPFILFIAFIIFKRQWTKEGRLAKVGTAGKLELGLMTYMLLSVLWSPTKLDTLGCAGLWWGMFLIQVMIYNLARTKQKINKVIGMIVASAAANGLIGAIQIATYVLYIKGHIEKRWVLPTPFYKGLDKTVYEAMPFKISTSIWEQRASGFFSNPNLLATFMLISFPLACYLFLNAQSKKRKINSFIAITFISAGMAASLSRAGCYIIIGAWLFLFVVQIKRHGKQMLLAFVPLGGATIPSILTRYGVIKTLSTGTGKRKIDGFEAFRSTQSHLKIWKSMMDYIFHHPKALTVGTGFGMEESGTILATLYELKKPHSHNFLIEIWAELGIIGLVMLAVIIICVMGKLIEINSNSDKKITLVFAVSTAFVSLFVFGLTDYIFNSPKQIILMMILIGITQAMSYVYEKTLIDSPTALGKVAKQDVYNVLHQ